MTSSTSRFILPLVVFLGGASLVGGAVFVISATQEQIAPSPIGGPFILQSGGKTVSSTELQGKPFLVFFGYTHCPDVCPTTLADISNVFKKLGSDAKIAALFITVDPQRDTPTLMQEYASSFDPRVMGLSGSPEAVAQAMKVYHASASKVPGNGDDYAMSHTAVVYLMDKEGRFVSALNLQQPPETVAKELSAYL